jgi:hypothetical protein
MANAVKSRMSLMRGVRLSMTKTTSPGRNL